VNFMRQRKLTNAVLDRRAFLAGASALGASVWASRMAFAASDGERRFLVVNLRGALDGLAAVPPYAGPHYANLRRNLEIAGPGAKGGAFKLDSTFGLHPSLAFMHERFEAREAIVFHAVATPYRERSHFDAQDVLEGGGERAHQFDSGWLNRALAASNKLAVAKEAGVALGNNVPLLMRGPATVASWAPSRLPQVDDATLDRIMDLYADDAVLGQRLGAALANDGIAAEAAAANKMAEQNATGSMADMQQSGAANPRPGAPTAGNGAHRGCVLEAR
jgi:uncharacterized protein (DUF1501 family)